MVIEYTLLFIQFYKPFYPKKTIAATNRLAFINMCAIILVKRFFVRTAINPKITPKIPAVSNAPLTAPIADHASAYVPENQNPE